ncbi:AraC family transcriptional regulator [Niabella pedocola]|uniref:AraC family transcriptional regulator n=1 Tax=Niabella pedocola TaxID=1752077 RepID=A0ABS8PXM0_9BACT|nr:AraC family transcriptional regulator [Niabella pedocola]MCD2425093.1 AraC family transcriptional regulator [Niabella pedocola]
MLEEHVQPTKKKDGFNGQKSIVLPRNVLNLCRSKQLLSNLYLTDIGFYPNAQYHYRRREQGCAQHILIYCTEGQGWVSFDHITKVIRGGEYLIIPANKRHRYGADPNIPWSIYWAHFTGETSSEFVNLLTKDNENLIGPAADNEKRTALFGDIYSTLETGHSIPHLCYINMLFSSYLGTFCFPQFLSAPLHEERSKMDEVIAYMQEHIHSVCTLTELAALVHISPSHFSSLFKKKTGYPPLEYFNHLKIQRACQYLEFTDIPVKEICYKLGMTDPFYFSRVFSKYLGEAPVAFRKRKRFNQLS